jgi:hypothetical protein
MLNAEKRMRWLLVAAVILTSPTAQAQSAEIVLLCEGTRTGPDVHGADHKDGLMTRVIVNFTTGTVQLGFDVNDVPVRITAANDLLVDFHGRRSSVIGNEKVEHTITGGIGRLNGDLEAEQSIVWGELPVCGATRYTAGGIVCFERANATRVHVRSWHSSAHQAHRAAALTAMNTVFAVPQAQRLKAIGSFAVPRSR